MSQPTLSRRISLLEDHLGTKLLIRSPRHLQLTGVGQRVIAQARNMNAEARALQNAVMDADSFLEGTVRISTTDGLGITWLTPHLADFQLHYPAIKIELILSDSTVNLLSREADIAVRLLRPSQQDIITRKVGDLHFAFYASHGYLERRGRPRSQQDLPGHQAVGLLGTTPTARWIRDVFGDDAVLFRASTMQGIHSAICQGIGIGPAFCFRGDTDPDLVRVLPDVPVMHKEIWLATLPELSGNARIRTTYNFLADLFVKHRAELVEAKPVL